MSQLKPEELIGSCHYYVEFDHAELSVKTNRVVATLCCGQELLLYNDDTRCHTIIGTDRFSPTIASALIRDLDRINDERFQIMEGLRRRCIEH